jgi:hypothetical protein
MKSYNGLENKSLMTLFRDFICILSEAMAASGFNTLDVVLIKENFRKKGTDQSIIEWNQIQKEIKDYNDELNHYRLNFMNNPAVYQGLALNKLSEYRIMTISGLKSIKRHALYTNERTALLNQIAEDLRSSCNLLLNLIIEIVKINSVDLPLLEEEA